MPNKVDSSFFRLLIVEESSFKVTPPSPAMNEARINGESITFAPEYVTSQELRSDRQVPDLVQVGAEVSGDTPFELSYGSYDDLLQAALFGTWSAPVAIAAASDISAVADAGSGDSELQSVSTDFVAAGVVPGQWLKVSGYSTPANNDLFQVKAVAVDALTLYGARLADEAAPLAVDIKSSGMLRNGITKRSFTVEKQFTDEGLFQVFRGLRVAGFELNFESGSILAGQFSFMGAEGNEMTAGPSIAGSIIPADTNEKFNAVADLTRLEKDDLAITADLMSLTISHDNGLRGQPAIGTLGYTGIGAGRSNTEGSISVYLDSVSRTAFYNAGFNNQAFKLSFRVGDNAGNYQVWTLYRAKLNDLNANAEQIDQDVLIDSGFQAVIDRSGIGYTIQVDRFSATA